MKVSLSTSAISQCFRLLVLSYNPCRSSHCLIKFIPHLTVTCRSLTCSKWRQLATLTWYVDNYQLETRTCTLACSTAKKRCRDSIFHCRLQADCPCVMAFNMLAKFQKWLLLFHELPNHWSIPLCQGSYSNCELE